MEPGPRAIAELDLGVNARNVVLNDELELRIVQGQAAPKRHSIAVVLRITDSMGMAVIESPPDLGKPAVVDLGGNDHVGILRPDDAPPAAELLVFLEHVADDEVKDPGITRAGGGGIDLNAGKGRVLPDSPGLPGADDKHDAQEGPVGPAHYRGCGSRHDLTRAAGQGDDGDLEAGEIPAADEPPRKAGQAQGGPDGHE